MAGVTANFLHRKKDGAVWYYRRRYPAAVARALGKATFLRSLKTTDKQEATRLSRAVSVEFDKACASALREATPTQGNPIAASESVRAGTTETRRPDPRLAIPELVAKAMDTLLAVPTEEYHRARADTLAVLGLMERGEFPRGVSGAEPMHPVQAAAVAAAIADPLHPIHAEPSSTVAPAISAPAYLPVAVDVPRALALYREKVGDNRYRLVSSALEPIALTGDAEAVQQQLKEWAEQRLQEVQPRTVKVTLTGLVSCLRCVLPDLKAPELRALRGVLEPRADDKQPATVATVRAIVHAAENRQPRVNDNVSAQWDALMLRCLAILGCRPSELLDPGASMLVDRQDVHGNRWTVLRIQKGKNKTSPRDIPLDDVVLPLADLREFITWRDAAGLKVQASVNSLNMRLRSRYLKDAPDKDGVTTYSLRHTWAAIAKSLDIDFEVRERLMGHKVQGMAAVYGEGVPMQKALEALKVIRAVLDV